MVYKNDDEPGDKSWLPRAQFQKNLPFLRDGPSKIKEKPWDGGGPGKDIQGEKHDPKR